MDEIDIIATVIGAVLLGLLIFLLARYAYPPTCAEGFFYSFTESACLPGYRP